MGWRAVRRSISVAVVRAVALAAPATRGVDELLVVVRGGRRPADVDEHRRAASSGVTGPERDRASRATSPTRSSRSRASGENAGGGEVKENLVDGSTIYAKWLVFEPTGWVAAQARPSRSRSCATRSTSANDAAERDPRDWTLQGSNDGTDLDDARHADRPGLRASASRPRSTRSPTTSRLPLLPARHHRATTATTSIQLAELQLSNGDTTPPPARDMRSSVGDGPARRLQREVRRRLHRRARAAVRRRAHRRRPRLLLQQGLRRRRRGHARTELSYLIYPEFERDDLSYPSTYAAVDLAFTDGTLPQRPRRRSTSTARR